MKASCVNVMLIELLKVLMEFFPNFWLVIHLQLVSKQGSLSEYIKQQKLVLLPVNEPSSYIPMYLIEGMGK